MEDREAAASAEAAHAEAAEAARAEDLAAEARAEAEASVAEDLEVTTDRRITDRPIFTARISAGADTDRAITAVAAEVVSVRF